MDSAKTHSFPTSVHDRTIRADTAKHFTTTTAIKYHRPNTQLLSKANSNEWDVRIVADRVPRYANWDQRHRSKLVTKLRCETQQPPLKLVIAVFSHTASFTRREAVRKTWGRGKNFRTYFFVGHVGESNVMSQLRAESMKEGDIIMGDFHESFYNNSRKVEMILEWSYKYCPSKYLFKTDDDSFINVPNLFSVVSALPTRGVYMGRVHEHASPSRQHPVYGVSVDEYRLGLPSTYSQCFLFSFHV